MREEPGNIWDTSCHALLVPTQGPIANQKEVKYCLDITQKACSIWPNFRTNHFQFCNIKGNNVQIVKRLVSAQDRRSPPYSVLSFPISPRWVYPETWEILPKFENFLKNKTFLPGWAGRPSLDIIRHSAEECVSLLKEYPRWERIAVPMIADGYIEWSLVHEVLNKVFDDRFFLVRGF